jgi:hypothetical protein
MMGHLPIVFRCAGLAFAMFAIDGDGEETDVSRPMAYK